MGGHRPFEDRPTRFEIVRDHRPDQAVTGEVLVGVDQPGDRQLTGSADRLAVRVRSPHRNSRADGSDPTVGDGDRNAAAVRDLFGLG
jgi:hypothetical protein